MCPTVSSKFPYHCQKQLLSSRLGSPQLRVDMCLHGDTGVGAQDGYPCELLTYLPLQSRAGLLLALQPSSILPLGRKWEHSGPPAAHRETET